MKILKKPLFAILCTALLAGCSAAPKEEGPQTDEDFVLNVSDALEARWNKTDSVDADMLSTSDQQKHFGEAVKAEKEKIGDLDDYVFEDEELKKIAESYLKGLTLQEEGIQYVGTEDYMNYDETWQLGFYYRDCAIHDLNENFGLTVSAKHKETYEDMLAEYSVAKTAVTLQEFEEELTQKLEYKKNEEQSDEYSATYSAVIENTTDVNIQYLSIQVDFLDTNGISIYQSTDSKNNIAPGAKVQSDVRFDTEKGEPKDIKVTIMIQNY